MNFGAFKLPWGKNKEESVTKDENETAGSEFEPGLKLVDLEAAPESKKKTVEEILEGRQKADALLSERKQIKQEAQEDRKNLELKDFSFQAKNQEMIKAVFGEDIARLKEIKKELADLSKEYGIDLEKMINTPQESLALFEEKVRNSKLDVVQASSDMSSASSKPLAEIEQLKRRADQQVERFWQLADLQKRYLDKVYPDEALIANMGTTIKRLGNKTFYQSGTYFTIKDQTLRMDQEMARNQGNPSFFLNKVKAMPDRGGYNNAGETNIEKRIKYYLVEGGQAVKDMFAPEYVGMNAGMFFEMVKGIADFQKSVEDRPAYKTYEKKFDLWLDQIIVGKHAEEDIDERYQEAVAKKSSEASFGE